LAVAGLLIGRVPGGCHLGLLDRAPPALAIPLEDAARQLGHGYFGLLTVFQAKKGTLRHINHLAAQRD
jgi:hypothetical protein